MKPLFSHLSLGVNDLERSRRFYDAALAPLGIVGRVSVAGEIAYTWGGADAAAPNVPAFFIGFEDPAARRPVAPSAGFHIAFQARSPAEVDAFYLAALAAGGRDNGPPSLRTQYHSAYYGAFVLDPDGHHVEATCFIDETAQRA